MVFILLKPKISNKRQSTFELILCNYIMVLKERTSYLIHKLTSAEMNCLLAYVVSQGLQLKAQN